MSPYQRNKVVAVCVLHVRPDGKVLAVARRHTENEWGLPGGKVDYGEEPTAAARREMYEETYTTPHNLKEIYSSQGSIDKYYVVTYITDKIEGFPKQGDAGPVKYVTWQELFEGPFGDYNFNLWKHWKSSNK